VNSGCLDHYKVTPHSYMPIKTKLLLTGNHKLICLHPSLL